MAEIVMLPVAPYELGDRQVFNTGVSTVGRGGHDYYCAHCGRQMVHNMDLARIEAEIVYACGGCGGLNVPPPVE
jgi:predicted SprT family Zn-dependent metalloprotease